MPKYGNVKTTIDGHVFDSKAEARYYQALRLLEQTGDISNLVMQPKYELQPAFRDTHGKWQAAIHYIADFEFIEQGKTIAVDVKGMVTQAFAMKAKLFKYKFRDIELRIIKV